MENYKKKTISGLGFRLAERVTVQLLTVIVLIVLARILSPSDYGLIALVNDLITILNEFVESGLGSALIQNKDADLIDFSTVFWAQFLISFFIYGVLFLFAPLFARMYNQTQIKVVLRVMGLRLHTYSVSCACSDHLR